MFLLETETRAVDAAQRLISVPSTAATDGAVLTQVAEALRGARQKILMEIDASSSSDEIRMIADLLVLSRHVVREAIDVVRLGSRRSGTWPAPRGPRGEDGSWLSTLLGRNLDNAGGVERYAVVVYRDLMTQFVAARARAEMSLRQLSEASGISLSVLTAMEQGSAWPRLATLQTAARVLSLEVDVNGSRDVLAALLERTRDIPQLSLRDVAVDAGLRPNTVYDLRTPRASPSMTTILALSYSVGADVRLLLLWGRPAASGATSCGEVP